MTCKRGVGVGARFFSNDEFHSVVAFISLFNFLISPKKVTYISFLFMILFTHLFMWNLTKDCDAHDY